jgi:mRNA interferase YafQ
MLRLTYSSQFKKDFKKVRKLPIEDLKEIFQVISQLEANKPLTPKYKDHGLVGNWLGFRECHIKPDLLLIYRIVPSELQLARLGSHGELFKK